MNGAQITINGITGTLTIEERFPNRFGGAVVYKRPVYKAMLAHGVYVDNVGNYSSKALASKFSVADAEAFIARAYPVKAAAVAVPAAEAVAGEDLDLLAFLGFPA